MAYRTQRMTLRQGTALSGSLGGEAKKWDIGEKLVMLRLDSNGAPYFEIGNSSTAQTLTAGTPRLQLYTTCSSTSGSTSVEPFYMKSTMTGAGGVGGRAHFHMYTTADLGGWCNALKGYSEFGTSGRCTGLASAVLAEMKLPSESIVSEGGAYFPLEIEYVAAGNALVTAGALSGNHAGFMWLQASGDNDGDFDDNGFFMHVKGLTAGADHLLSLASQTLKCGLAGTTTRYLVLSQMQDGLGLGNSSTSMTLSTYANHAIEVYTTCASTDTGNSVQPIYMKSTMTGAGGVGGRACFHMYTTADLGGWCNALKGYAEFGTSGTCSGLASAIVAEMKLPSESIVAAGGGYFPLEIEYVAAGNGLVTAGALSGNHAGFIWCQASGDDDGDFDDNGFFMHVKGLTAGANHLLSLASQTLKCGLAGTTTRYLVLSQMQDGLGLGNSTTSMTLSTYANHAIEVYTTCASEDGSNSVEPIYMKSTMTGAGGVGGRARFHTYSNVALGSWCNGLKGYMEFGTSGRVTGLASAICGEITLSAGTTQGNYCALEAELIADSEVSTGTATAFLYCNIAGTNSTGITTINTNGYFCIIGDGIADTNGGMFEAETIGTVSATHVLRWKIDGVDYWMALNTAKTM